MHSDKTAGRIIGIILLIIFILGVTIFQFLQGEQLFSDEFMTETAAHATEIITSVLLGMLSGTLSIIIAIILLPIVTKYSPRLAYVYLAFCILNFLTIAIDNFSVLSMLTISQEYVKNLTGDLAMLSTLGTVFYESHWWTHHLFLLMSCLPVFVLFYTLYSCKLVPNLFSIFGMFAALVMFIEILLTLYGKGISSNLMLPIALIQFAFPFWLMFKGFIASKEQIEIDLL